ncbi:IQ motif and ubiquitin-like domain-containing protein isoform X2 [Latimeria chalumnae]|uniref:IQ motif and ubiquitin-like domain-containing protein isoform X2 n=1 Tax=Latimeria chalumnae TaxID=7897 RepID=UPI0003C0FEA6|nr:PREDICTED: IQ and ubiquitin-like domain-containing protein isoform X2 [Latimeria chalumnae]|eukprot:XP_014349289.1 PREDICTED: IQ and ubiquitin-like domain-containing protein isoform X2 [Latimeria chalumnae]
MTDQKAPTSEQSLENTAELSEADQGPGEVTTELSEADQGPGEVTTELADDEQGPGEVTTESAEDEQGPGEVTTESAEDEQGPGELITEISEAGEMPGELTEKTPESEQVPGEPTTERSEAEQAPDELTMEISETEQVPGEVTTETSEAEQAPDELTIEISETEQVPGEVTTETSEGEQVPDELTIELPETEELFDPLMTENEQELKPEESADVDELDVKDPSAPFEELGESISIDEIAVDQEKPEDGDAKRTERTFDSEPVDNDQVEELAAGKHSVQLPSPVDNETPRLDAAAVKEETTFLNGVKKATATGKLLKNSVILMDLGVIPNGTVQIEMSSTDPENYPIRPVNLQQEYNMPDVITVRVQTDATTYQDVVVEIERCTFHKPFLGGYKHKVTGVEFHNAGTQTRPKKRPDKGIDVFCRDTQTVVEKHQYQQTANTTSTQMNKIGCYISNMTDKLSKPKKYLTAAELRAIRLIAVIVIQKYFRRWHAKRYVDGLRRQRDQRLEWEREEELHKKREKEARLRQEYERRMNPKTKEDFDLLYNALAGWKQEELDHINSTLTGAERKAALCALQEQEAQLIASIGRHKLDADEENHQKSIQSLLDKCAAPKKWKAFDGLITEMDTQFTIRARQLRDIYNSITMKYLTHDERLDALLTLKHTIKEHNCKLTQEIMELIDREADLLMRQVKDSNLEGLRKRIATLFLQYIKTPTFNPEIVRLLKVPQDPTILRKDVYFCSSCCNYLPSTEFPLGVNSRTVGRCQSCIKVDNDGRGREELSEYKRILRHLWKSEAKYQDDAKIAFLLQEQDLRYLVEKIWAAQSILSAWDDLGDLVLIRWDKYCEWSPWNCILLTQDEAAAHFKLADIEKAYGAAFLRKVKYRHTLAKKFFSQIPVMARFLHGSQPLSYGSDLLITKPIPFTSSN